MPKISIITITFNAESFIERTLQSIDNQTNKNFEYLIIDGKSTDKTLEICHRYSSIITRIVSEKDDGLYDAMNKGQRLATGDYVWFMNAGDEITTQNAVERLNAIIDAENPDVIYGESFYTDKNGKILGTRSNLTTHRLPDNLTWQQMNRGMLVCHQAFLVRRAIAPPYMENNLSADLDWEIQSLKNARKVVKFEGVLANYLVGGVSTQQLRRSLTDRFFVLVKHFGWAETLKNHALITARGLKKILKKGKYWE